MNNLRNHNTANASSENGHFEGQRWLTTFNDMITLLMVFFVLLFSMGSMDVKRFKHFQNALQSAMGVLHEGRRSPMGILAEKPVPSFAGTEGSAKRTISENVKTQLDSTQGLRAEYTAHGIHLTLDDKLLFASASALLTADGTQLLDKVAGIIKPLNRYIRVEGHTDNRPIANTLFAGNWELSTARAISVVKYLIDKNGIEPQLLSAAGYGDCKPRVPNDSEINMSKNRRVEIILGQAVKNGGNQYVE